MRLGCGINLVLVLWNEHWFDCGKTWACKTYVNSINRIKSGLDICDEMNMCLDAE